MWKVGTKDDNRMGAEGKTGWRAKGVGKGEQGNVSLSGKVSRDKKIRMGAS